MKRVLPILVTLLAATPLAASGNMPMYFGGFLARPLAMGGAVTAVPSAEFNHLYNPAATVFTDDDNSFLVMWFDAIRILYGISMLQMSEEPASYQVNKESLENLVWIPLEQASYGNRHWEVKLSLWEQLPSLQLQTPTPDGNMDEMLHNEVTTVTGSLNLPFIQGLQAGASLQFYNMLSGANQGAGYSAGLYWGPSTAFSLGLFYFGMPSGDLDSIRVPLEQLHGDSLNLGLSVKLENFLFFNALYLSCDIRDVANRFIPRIGGEAGVDIFKYMRFSAFAGFAATQPIKYFSMDNLVFSGGLELNFFDPRVGGYVYARFSAVSASRDANVPHYGVDSQPYYKTATIISLGYARFFSL